MGSILRAVLFALALSVAAFASGRPTAGSTVGDNAQLAALGADLDNPALLLIDATETTAGAAGEITMVVCTWEPLSAATPNEYWVVAYTFPSTIWAHSLIKVKMHAEEMH